MRMEMSIIEHMSNISEKMRSDDKDRIRRTAQVLIMTAVLQYSARGFPVSGTGRRLFSETDCRLAAKYYIRDAPLFRNASLQSQC